MEQGAIRALVVVEEDPLRSFRERLRVKEAMDRLEFLVVLGYLPSSTEASTDVFLPTKTMFETMGTFVNQEGRAQQAFRVHNGGLPIALTGGGGHPPRSFSADIPGGEPVAAWEILERLNRALRSAATEIPAEQSAKDLWKWLAEKDAVFTPLIASAVDGEGIRLVPGKNPESGYSREGLTRRKEEQGAEETMELLLVERIYGTEALSTYSEPLRQMERTPWLWIHTKDAERLGFKNKDTIRLLLGGEEVRIELCTIENMAPGVIILPRHRQLEWQKPGDLSAGVLLDSIMKT
jgi:NADH-quinone oxidoreductase subunit G